MAEMEEIAQIAANLAMSLARSPETMAGAQSVNTLTQDNLSRLYQERREEEEKKKKKAGLLSAIGGTVGSMIPIPGLGTAAGAAVGGALGTAAGGMVGGENPESALMRGAGQGVMNFATNKAQDVVQNSPYTQTRQGAQPLDQNVGAMLNPRQEQYAQPGKIPQSTDAMHKGGAAQGVDPAMLPQKGLKQRVAEVFLNEAVQENLMDLIGSPQVDSAKIPFGLGQDRVGAIDQRFADQEQAESARKIAQAELGIRREGLDIDREGLGVQRESNQIRESLGNRQIDTQVSEGALNRTAQSTERGLDRDQRSTEFTSELSRQASEREEDRIYEIQDREDQQAFTLARDEALAKMEQSLPDWKTESMVDTQGNLYVIARGIENGKVQQQIQPVTLPDGTPFQVPDSEYKKVLEDPTVRDIQKILNDNADDPDGAVEQMMNRIAMIGDDAERERVILQFSGPDPKVFNSMKDQVEEIRTGMTTVTPQQGQSTTAGPSNERQWEYNDRGELVEIK